MSNITHSKIILVEGKDEVEFFTNLFERDGISEFQVIEYGGIGNFKNKFPLIIQDPNFDGVISLAVIRDADENVEGAYSSIAYYLNKYGLPIPPNACSVNSNAQLRVGIYIMPGDGCKGMLETLVLDSVNSHPVRYHAYQYIDELAKNDDHKPNNIHKAKLHAFLSGMKEYVPNIGQAVKKGYFNLNDECFHPLKEFIKQL